MAEKTWNSLNVGGDKGPEFLKLNPGITQVRFASNPYEVFLHWEKTRDGLTKKVICPESNCPICKQGKAPMRRIQVYAVDRQDKKIKILEQGNSLFSQIKGYVADEEYGDPTKYDIKIKKEGSGKETRYTAIASAKKSDLTPEELEQLEQLPPLSEVNKAKTVEEIYAMNLEVLPEKAPANNGWTDITSDNSKEQTSGKASSDDFDDWGDDDSSQNEDWDF